MTTSCIKLLNADNAQLIWYKIKMLNEYIYIFTCLSTYLYAYLPTHLQIWKNPLNMVVIGIPNGGMMSMEFSMGFFFFQVFEGFYFI